MKTSVIDFQSYARAHRLRPRIMMSDEYPGMEGYLKGCFNLYTNYPLMAALVAHRTHTVRGIGQYRLEVHQRGAGRWRGAYRDPVPVQQNLDFYDARREISLFNRYGRWNLISPLNLGRLTLDWLSALGLKRRESLKTYAPYNRWTRDTLPQQEKPCSSRPNIRRIPMS